VADTSHNEGVDLKLNDQIVSIDGRPAEYLDQIEPILQDLKGQSVPVKALRAGDTITRVLKISDDAKLGIYRVMKMSVFEDLGYLQVTRKEYGFLESFAAGGRKFNRTLGNYGAQLKAIFSPSTGAYKGLGGFKAIYDQFPTNWSWSYFWGLTAFLSIMLAVLNLLPIPALDGGHVMFLLFEMISGKKPSEKFLERAQIVGFFILIALVVFANGNDIFKALTN
jgi:regulator of sigma E protease